VGLKDLQVIRQKDREVVKGQIQQVRKDLKVQKLKVQEELLVTTDHKAQQDLQVITTQVQEVQQDQQDQKVQLDIKGMLRLVTQDQKDLRRMTKDRKDIKDLQHQMVQKDLKVILVTKDREGLLVPLVIKEPRV